MTVVMMGGRVLGSLALVSAVLAAAMTWLLLSDPATVTQAMADGSMRPLAEALLDAIGGALRRVLGWL